MLLEESALGRLRRGLRRRCGVGVWVGGGGRGEFGEKAYFEFSATTRGGKGGKGLATAVHEEGDARTCTSGVNEEKEREKGQGSGCAAVERVIKVGSACSTSESTRKGES